jgi:hypothetical protein
MTCDDVVVGLEEVIEVAQQGKRWFGMAGPFPILFTEAWKEDEHVFSAEGGSALIKNDTQRLGPPERVTTDVLNRYPVEVLAVKETLQPNKSQPRFWVKWINKCKPANLPDYVIISASSKELVEEDGLQSKPWRWTFQEWGYKTHYWFLRSHEHGGVVRQDRCMLVL